MLLCVISVSQNAANIIREKKNRLESAALSILLNWWCVGVPQNRPLAGPGRDRREHVRARRGASRSGWYRIILWKEMVNHPVFRYELVDR